MLVGGGGGGMWPLGEKFQRGEEKIASFWVIKSKNLHNIYPCNTVYCAGARLRRVYQGGQISGLFQDKRSTVDQAGLLPLIFFFNLFKLK